MRKAREKTVRALTVLFCLTLCTRVSAGVLFSESFSGFTGGNFNGGQYQSNLDLAYGGNMSGWTKAGAGAVHVVDHANTTGNIDDPRDFAPMLWGGDGLPAANTLTLDTAIPNSNLLGQRYQVGFLASPAVYQGASQASTAADGVLVEVLRGDNSVLASRVHLSGAWAGTIDLQPGGFQYTGDGSGGIRFRLSPSNPGVGRFGSAIDNLQLATTTTGDSPVSSNGTAVINELHYNPPLSTSPSEFIEIYNGGLDPLDLTGWTLSGGVDFAFPAGATLPSGEYLVIAENSNEFQTVFGFVPLGQWELGDRLSNDGERLTLRDGNGRRVDEVDYGVGFPWPTAADGAGPSMELIHPFVDNDLGGAWRSTFMPSPGVLNGAFTTNVPPRIRQVRHVPEQPMAGTNVLISAKVTDPDGVAYVTLSYQLVDPGSYIRKTDAAYELPANWTNLAMNDNGLNGDAAAGDATWSVTVPASLQVHRRLVRYRITVEDSLTHSVRVPYTDDGQPNFAYFVYDGVPAWTGAKEPGVTPATNVPAEVMANALPVYHLVADATDVVNCQYNGGYDGVRMWGTMVYDGRVYDHIQFYNRGEVSTYESGKNKWRFRFNRTRDFRARSIYGKRYKTDWKTMNFNSCASPWVASNRGMAGIDEAVPHRLYQLAGVPSSHTHWIHFRVVDAVDEAPPDQYAGDLWGLYFAVEHPDGHFLDERDLPDGNTYKIWNGTGNKKNQGPTQPLDNSDWDAFWAASANLNTVDWWRSNFALESFYGFRAINRATGNVDMRDGSNYYMYHHPDGRWHAVPWDLDMMYAPVSHWSGVIRADRCLDHAEVRTEFRNRCRELVDLLFSDIDRHGGQAAQVVEELSQIVNPGGVPLTMVDVDEYMWSYHPRTRGSHRGPWYELSIFETRLRNDYYRTIPTPDHEGFQQSIVDYMFDTRPGGGFAVNDGIEDGYGFGFLSQEAADSAIPDRPTITYSGAVGHPVNALTFTCGPFSDPDGTNTFGAMRWRIGEIANPATTNFNPGKPWRYEIDAQWESAVLSNYSSTVEVPAGYLEVGCTYRARVRMMDNTGRWSHWSEPYPFLAGIADNVTALSNNLRVTEVMYHAAGGSDYDFIEFHNTSPSVLLTLDGVMLTEGVDYTFPPGTVLTQGAYLVVAKLPGPAFDARYGDGMTVLGPYEGNLSDGGEDVIVEPPGGGAPLITFDYSDGRGWPLEADGAGHSLVPLLQDDQSDGSLDHPANWRASAVIDGSPGRADPDPPAGIVINEFAAHTDFSDTNYPAYDSDDWIELYNPLLIPVEVTNYFLSDEAALLKKWEIPSRTLLPGEWVSYDEVHGFHNPITNGFGLDKAGEQIFLSHLPGMSGDRVVDCIRFKAQENGRTLGRYRDGEVFWYAMPPTRDGANRLDGPPQVVIRELMFAPPGTNLLEYVELANPGSFDVPLWNPSGTWRMDGGIDFSFPSNITIGAGARLVLVPFAPTNAADLNRFVTTYGLTNGQVEILGPYRGRLSDLGERIALEKPQAPDFPDTEIDWVIVDEVYYGRGGAWPSSTYVTGHSLHRIRVQVTGHDPSNWLGVAASPGIVFGPVVLRGGRFGPFTFRLEWTASPGAAYVVESARDLVTGGWTEEATVTGNGAVWFDDTLPTLLHRKYYRIRLIE